MQGFSILVPVTQKHIDDGKKQDCQKCVIALAIKDALNKNRGVDKDKIEIVTLTNHSVVRIDGGRAFSIGHPGHISSFIRNFDRDVPVKPTRFMAHFK